VEALKQYEIWWAALPKPAGRRPVLLLSRNESYTYLTKVLAVEITTTIRHIPVEVPVGRREGLTRPSVANCDNVHTVTRDALRERIGVLASSRHFEVKRALGHALAWFELMDVQTAN
jgi:mRNA interferase MazF